MARADIFIAAPPERVFAVLSDPRSYAYWVLGSDTIRAADEHFPAVGSRFHHRVGVGPLKVNDHTEVLDTNPPYRIELRARARPLGTLHVTILLEPRGAGTHVTLLEEPADPMAMLTFNPIAQLLMSGRNAQALRRLKELAEGRAAA